MPQGPGGVRGRRSHPQPRIQDARRSRLRSQPGKMGSGGIRVGAGEQRGRLPSEPLHRSLLPSHLVLSNIGDILNDQ